MREAIDFNDYDKVSDGFDDEPHFRPVHREELPLTITGGVQVDRSVKKERGVKFKELFSPPVVSLDLLAHKECAVFENDEPNWLESLPELLNRKGIDVLGPDIIPFAKKLLSMLEISDDKREDVLEMATSFLRDTIMCEEGWDYIDADDRWRWNRRYPRLTASAKSKFAAFEMFKKNINWLGINLPDLTKPQETSSDRKMRQEKELQMLRRAFEQRNPKYASKAA